MINVPKNYEGFIASANIKNRELEAHLIKTIAVHGYTSIETIKEIAQKRFNCVPYIYESLRRGTSPEQLRDRAVQFVGKPEILVFGIRNGLTSLEYRITSLEDFGFSEDTQSGVQQ